MGLGMVIVAALVLLSIGGAVYYYSKHGSGVMHARRISASPGVAVGGVCNKSGNCAPPMQCHGTGHGKGICVTKAHCLTLHSKQMCDSVFS
jgi:hypothetical protein